MRPTMRPWILIALCTVVQSTELQHSFFSPIPSKDAFDAKAAVSVPTIVDWTATPNGEGAAMNVRTFDPIGKTATNELWLLPVNAQFSVDAQPIYNITQDTLFTWLSNTTLAVLQPTGTTSWDLHAITFNYTVAPPAYPPAFTKSRLLNSFPVLVTPKKLAYSSGVLAFISDAYDDEDLATILAQDAEDFAKGQGWTGGWVYEGTWARHGNTWTRRKQPRLFLIDLVVAGSDLDEEWNLKSKMFRTPLLGTGIIPDTIKLASGEIAIVAKDPEVHPALHTRTNIYLLPCHGNSKPILVSSGTGGKSTSPVFNSHKIAWLEQEVDADATAHNVVWMWDRKIDKKWKVDVDSYPFNPQSLEFSLRGDALFLLTEHHAQTSLYHTWTSEGPTDTPVRATLIPTNGTIHQTVHVGITPLEHSHLISLKSFVDKPAELYMTSHSPYDNPADNLEEIRLTSFGSIADAARLSSGQTLWVDGVQSQLFRPSSVNSDKVPLLVLLHDLDTERAWRNTWEVNWNPNVFLSEGYAVLRINAAGSSGYSDAFGKHHDARKVAQDIKVTLSYVLQNVDNLDPSNTFALGLGYGGYIANWLNAHNDEFGFSAFIAQSGIFSLSFVAFETDEIYRAKWIRTLNASQLVEEDPINLLSRWNTPTLFVHGGEDFRIPESQSIAAYNALQSRGIESRILYFPTEGSTIRAMENVLKWYTEVFRFLKERRQ